MDEIHPHIDAIAATENDSNNKNPTQILFPETEGGKGAKSCRKWKVLPALVLIMMP